MLTANGFRRKTYEEYVEELEQQARELFGANVNLTDNGPMGKWIRLISFARAEENELAEAIYYSAYYETAEGISLDYTVKYAGMQRLQAEKAIVDVDLSVELGETIPAGLVVATTDNIEFVTLEDVTDVNGVGLITAPAEARLPGSSGNVPPNTITIINTPVIGLNAVTNPEAAKNGREMETDKELRDRYADSGSSGLSSTVAGIKTTILTDVVGSTSAVVIENNESEPDAKGRPPHSFETIVYGGSIDDIAQAILKAKPAGIRAWGAQSVTIQDDSGKDQVIGFSLAVNKEIYAKVTLVTNTSFPTNGMNDVKMELLKYVGGTDAEGNLHPGLGMGNNVVNTQATFSVIRNVPGVDDVTILFSTDGSSYTSGNITVEPTEVAQLSYDRIVIS